MANYNKVVLMGNLTRDPELRYTSSGQPIAKLGMAMNRRYKGRDDQMKDETTFVDVTSFGRVAETLSKYLRKGSPVLVDGRLHLDKWETPQGEKRSRIEVVAENFQFLPRAKGPFAPGERGMGDESTETVDADPPQTLHDGDGGRENALPF